MGRLTLFLCGLILGSAVAAQDQLIVTNAKITTLDNQQYSAFAVKDGRFSEHM